MKLCIIGPPHSGKTTLADRLSLERNVHVFHTDDLMHQHWSDASERASHYFDEPGEWIIDGTMAIRALRKWLERNPEARPDFQVLYLTALAAPYTSAGQDVMAKGIETVYAEIVPRLLRQGIKHRKLLTVPDESFQL